MVYEEDMVHRPAGSGSGACEGTAAAGGGAALVDVEEAFAPAASWLADEVRAEQAGSRVVQRVGG